MKIIFMGTPDFAKAHLERLCEDGHDVVAVVSQPDKPKGRKKIITPPPVKVYAIEKNIPVYQPETLKDCAIIDILKQYNPDIIVVVAYGKILPEYILSYPKFGCINVHGSLLPEYRGAAPVQRAIIDGKKVTGVTVMYMDKGLDTGDMILKKECIIEEDDNQETLFAKMEKVGCDALTEALALIKSGKNERVAQNDAESTYAEMLDATTGKIDWTKDNFTVHNLVRGTYPWPCAFTFYNGIKFKILQSVRREESGAPGTVIISSPKEGLVVACQEGAVEIVSLQSEGGKRMLAKDYLLGHDIPVGSILE